MRRPFLLEGHTDTPLLVTASIGIATADDDGFTSGRLLANADLALYRAKAAGRDCAVTYTPDMRSDEPSPAPPARPPAGVR
jgi:GGDEF domain-containing protein